MKNINKFIDDTHTTFLDDIGKVSKNFYQKLVDYIIKYSNKGKLEYDMSLSQVEDDIKKILIESGYKSTTDNFIGSLSVIEDINIQKYQLFGLKKVIDNSERLSLAKDIITRNLKGIGVEQNIIAKIADIIRVQIINGSTYQELKNILHENLVKNSISVRYVNQISVDTLTEYNGAIQADIIDNFKPKGFYYVGDLIEGSRPFCEHMKEKYGTRLITFKELKIDLDKYCPNGIPDEKLGKGMKQGTNINNFAQYKGGHMCRHSVDLVF